MGTLHNGQLNCRVAENRHCAIGFMLTWHACIAIEVATAQLGQAKLGVRSVVARHPGGNGPSQGDSRPEVVQSKWYHQHLPCCGFSVLCCCEPAVQVLSQSSLTVPACDVRVQHLRLVPSWIRAMETESFDGCQLSVAWQIQIQSLSRATK